MFRTATTGYNVVDSTPFKRDIIKELADECARQGIVFCPYYSIGDWSAADVMKPEFKNYKEYMFAQLKELLTNYGDIRMLWFDNYWYVKDQWNNDADHAKELYNYVRSINPNVLVNDRCGRGVKFDDGDYATPENQLRGSLQSRYFEVVMTDTDDENWGWVRGATNYRKPAELIRNLIDCTSKGGNFVLNVGPMANGEFPPEHVAIIEAMGKWTTANGEAIYGAFPAPECVPQAVDGFVGYTTRKNNSIFLHIVQWPTDGGDVRVEIKRTGLVKVELLDPSLPPVESINRVDGGSTWVTLKKPAKVDPSATVVRLAFNPPASN
jgi:alpha-L-fucosidase